MAFDIQQLESDMEATRDHLAELLKGGFAPVVILLREFHYNKTDYMLDGLPFSTWSLLEHMRWRQLILLRFMNDPQNHHNVWPDPYWPDNPVPANEGAWNDAIDSFEQNLNEVIAIVKNRNTHLFGPQKNGKSIYWAAVAILQHNAYHIGQIKAIGRQLGVW
ncbi:hypothetical protein C900_02631 [Fulvivirga imtechensis AK7]|uniref:DinB-like domain-containing protein n=1 Tax=Fulvivirga imtechensis AK7 TaxID=1237149 RepID=L8JWV0_9BACT|nr:DinB family protein [Fulvivirga imtechensis]ELR73546.1 hypothetical protein C900_02631 [Fulvivirga imtechensis AK7]